MNWFSRHRLRLVLLGLLVLGCGLWLGRLDWKTHLATDVFALLPGAERDAAGELALGLLREREARLLYLVVRGADPQATPEAAAVEALAARLRSDPAIARVAVGRGPSDPGAWMRALHEARFALVFPDWLAERRAAHAASGSAEAFDVWLARTQAATLEDFLARPEALALAEALPADPLLLLPGLAERFAPLAGGGPEGTALLWVQSAAGPLDPAGQEPVFAAIAQATAAARAVQPDLQVEYGGIHRFAAESRERIRAEVTRLNLYALGAVVLLCALFLRGVRLLMPVAAVAVGALLIAWTATTLLCAPVHVIALLIGSLLTGLAVDYALHALLHTPRDPAAGHAASLREIGRPLLLGCGTTCAGFLVLAFSGLPLLRQVAVFVTAGLLGALLLCWLVLPLLPWRAPAPPRALPEAWRARWRGTRLGWALLGLALLGALPGLTRLHWDDDLRRLDLAHPELRAIQERVSAAFGSTPQRYPVLVTGSDLDAARARYALWRAALPAATPEPLSLAPLLPLPATRAAAIDFVRAHPDFPQTLAAALAARDFDPEAFAPFAHDWAAWVATLRQTDATAAYAAAVQRLDATLDGPLGNLLHLDPEGVWLLAVAELPHPEALPAIEGVTPVAQLQSLNRLFARYRHAVLEVAALGVALNLLMLLGACGWRLGLRIAAVPALAAVLALGLLGWLGGGLSLLHLAGLLLALSSGVDYAIFIRLAEARGEPRPYSIGISVATTLASFGALALSQLPAVRDLGLTVVAVVAAVFVILELTCRRQVPS